MYREGILILNVSVAEENGQFSEKSKQILVFFEYLPPAGLTYHGMI
jgi:hypothetical protein